MSQLFFQQKRFLWELSKTRLYGWLTWPFGPYFRFSTWGSWRDYSGSTLGNSNISG